MLARALRVLSKHFLFVFGVFGVALVGFAAWLVVRMWRRPDEGDGE